MWFKPRKWRGEERRGERVGRDLLKRKRRRRGERDKAVQIFEEK